MPAGQQGEGLWLKFKWAFFWEGSPPSKGSDNLEDLFSILLSHRCLKSFYPRGSRREGISCSLQKDLLHLLYLIFMLKGAQT